MYKILKAETLAAKIHLMVVHAPRVASHCQPGQFIIVKLDEKGERIPLTICDYDREEGTITIVFQEIGVSTIKMAELKAGDAFRDFVGRHPLSWWNGHWIRVQAMFSQVLWSENPRIWKRTEKRIWILLELSVNIRAPVFRISTTFL